MRAAAQEARARARRFVGTRDRAAWALVGITFLALVVRLAVAWRFADVRGYGEGDQRDYVLLAENIIGRNGYRTTGGITAWRPPGYPLLLAFVIRAGHALPWDVTVRGIVGVAQAVIGTMTVAVTGLLGRRVRGPVLALVAAAVLAVWPSAVLLTSVVLSETLFTFLVVAAVATVFWVDAPSRRRILVAGLLLGAAALVRSVVLPVVVVVALGLVLRRVDRRAAARSVAVLLLGVGLVLTPWVFRNLLDFGTFIPTDLHGGFALCMSNRDGAGPADGFDPACRVPDVDEVDNDRILRHRAFRWMAEHPINEASLVARRTVVLFGHDSDVVAELQDRKAPDPRFSDALGRRLSRAADLFWWVLLPVALVGVVVLLRWPTSRWPALALLSTLAVPLLVTISPRFHQPVLPLLALGIGATVDVVWRRARRPRKRLPSRT